MKCEITTAEINKLKDYNFIRFLELFLYDNVDELICEAWMECDRINKEDTIPDGNFLKDFIEICENISTLKEEAKLWRQNK